MPGAVRSMSVSFAKAALALAMVYMAINVIAAYWQATFGAEPIIDDMPTIMNYRDQGVFNNLLGDWTQVLYVASGKTDDLAKGTVIWSPLASNLQHIVAVAFGRDAIGPFRAVNVLVFAATCLAMAALISHLVRSVTIGVVVAGLLAMHPLGAETVPWASDLCDVLGGFFLVVGLLIAVTLGTTTKSYASVAAVFTLFACLSKATAGPLAIVFVLMAMAIGRSLGAVLITFVTVGLVAGVHHAAYNHVASGQQILGDITRVILTDPLRRHEFMLSWSAGWLDFLAPPAPPAVIRPISETLDLARANAGQMIVGLMVVGLLVACVCRQRFGWLGLAALGLWLAGPLPGTLIGISHTIRALRYGYMPLLVATPLTVMAIVAGFEVLARRVPDAKSAAVQCAVVLGIAGLALSWNHRVHDRLPDWHREVDLFEAEFNGTEEAGEPDGALRVLLARAKYFQYYYGFAKPEPEQRHRNPCAALLEWQRAKDEMPSNNLLSREVEVRYIEDALARGKKKGRISFGSCGDGFLGIEGRISTCAP